MTAGLQWEEDPVVNRYNDRRRPDIPREWRSTRKSRLVGAEWVRTTDLCHVREATRLLVCLEWSAWSWFAIARSSFLVFQFAGIDKVGHEIALTANR
jgi:hypothetical protein